jgi:neopullulanase
MNYQFTRACYSFFVDMDATTRTLTHGHSYGAIETYDARQFAQRLETLLAWYPSAIASAQLNLLGSHDTARFLTIARGDTSALKLAYLTMMTYPGAPMLYYGDEIGLEGGRDPDCRRAMLWDHTRWDPDLLGAVTRTSPGNATSPCGGAVAPRASVCPNKVYVFAVARPAHGHRRPEREGRHA